MMYYRKGEVLIAPSICIRSGCLYSKHVYEASPAANILQEKTVCYLPSNRRAFKVRDTRRYYGVYVVFTSLHIFHNLLDFNKKSPNSANYIDIP